MLLPAIPRRLSADMYLKAIVLTKRIMVADPTSGPTFTHAVHVITRHPQIFYQHRHHFVPHMLHSLSRVALTQTSTETNKMLALDAVHMILCWDLTQRYEAKKRKMKKKKKETSEVAAPFVLNSQMMSAILHFCMRLALLSSGGSVATTLKSVENRSMRLFTVRCYFQMTQ